MEYSAGAMNLNYHFLGIKRYCINAHIRSFSHFVS